MSAYVSYAQIASGLRLTQSLSPGLFRDSVSDWIAVISVNRNVSECGTPTVPVIPASVRKIAREYRLPGTLLSVAGVAGLLTFAREPFDGDRDLAAFHGQLSRARIRTRFPPNWRPVSGLIT